MKYKFAAIAVYKRVSNIFRCPLFKNKKKGYSMKKGLFILTVIFIALTFAGAWYVIFNKGGISAGYAAVPMIFTLIIMNFYRKCR